MSQADKRRRHAGMLSSIRTRILNGQAVQRIRTCLNIDTGLFRVCSIKKKSGGLRLLLLQLLLPDRLQHRLQVPRVVHAHQNVGPTNELALDKDLCRGCDHFEFIVKRRNKKNYEGSVTLPAPINEPCASGAGIWEAFVLCVMRSNLRSPAYAMN